MAMYPRRLSPPSRSFFLLGPRSTGKTTWLREKFAEARWYDLLLEAELVRFIREPDRLRQELAKAAPRSWVVIDEVQRYPPILNAVHDFLSRGSQSPRFVLTGSSARKLKRGQANLLAGRALSRHFFPLVAQEFGLDGLDVERLLRFGCLPQIVDAVDDAERRALLEAYGETYLAEEIRAEALVKNLASFSRFLEVAATMNGQITNVSSLARDSGVARPTVQGYFDVLVDTLLATWLPAFRPKARIKEVAHPKFFLFDTGAVRSLARRLREPLEAAERGPLLETYVLHELRAFINDADCGGDLSYWRTPSGFEVDFIWTRGGRRVAIEVKASNRWRKEEGAALKELTRSLPRVRAIGVYLGEHAHKDEEVNVWPLKSFLRELYAGRVLS
ncbi:MAG: ATP-binding protein [Myxococcaceae bacterium]